MMTTQTMTDIPVEIEDRERRNTEYMAKLERGFREIEEGKGITMTFEEWEKRFCNE